MKKLIIFISFLFLFVSCNEKISDEQKAYKKSKELVKDKLKAPSTSKFPENCKDIKEISPDYYKIEICVDAENSFGAMIRSDFIVELQKLNDIWRIYSIGEK